jgi:hypothetical protein
MGRVVPNMQTSARPANPTTAIGRVMAVRGLASAHRIATAEDQARHSATATVDTLRRSLGLPQTTVAALEAELGGLGVVDPITHPPDARLVEQIGAKACLRLGILPWRKISGQVVVLTADAHHAHRRVPALTAMLGPVRIALADKDRLDQALRRITDQQ